MSIGNLCDFIKNRIEDKARQISFTGKVVPITVRACGNGFVGTYGLLSFKVVSANDDVFLRDGLTVRCVLDERDKIAVVL